MSLHQNYFKLSHGDISEENIKKYLLSLLPFIYSHNASIFSLTKE